MRWFLTPSQSNMYVANAIACVLLFGIGIVAVMSGHELLLFPGMIVLSPVAMLLLRWWFEESFNTSFFKPSVMSWGFILGDTVILPTALLFAGIGWSRVLDGWYRSPWFATACFLFGLAGSVVFRRLDGQRYVDAGVPTALLSPTKVWHDWVVMPVVTAGLVWLLTPQVLTGPSVNTMLAFAALAMFGLALVRDMVHAPDPTLQHPEWDTVRFEAIA